MPGPPDRRLSFDPVPDVYDEIRPSYPPALFDALFQMYRKLVLSYSGTQMMSPGRREGLVHDLEAFVRAAFGDRVTRPLVATLTTAALA